MALSIQRVHDFIGGSSQSAPIVVPPRCSFDVNGVPDGVTQLTNIPSRQQGISLGL
jgi:hypothetical protein